MQESCRNLWGTIKALGSRRGRGEGQVGGTGRGEGLSSLVGGGLIAIGSWWCWVFVALGMVVLGTRRHGCVLVLVLIAAGAWWWWVLIIMGVCWCWALIAIGAWWWWVLITICQWWCWALIAVRVTALGVLIAVGRWALVIVCVATLSIHCCHLLFGCHVALSDMAPGHWGARWLFIVVSIVIVVHCCQCPFVCHVADSNVAPG